MNMRRYKIIKAMNITIIILLLIAIISFVTVIYIELRTDDVVVERYSPALLTREEMANRPIIKSSVTNERTSDGTATSLQAEEEIIAEPTYIAFKKIPFDYGIQVHMQKLCSEYHVNFAFALAIIESESNFNFVSGDSGRSIGYAQINMPNWYRYGLDAHYEYDNIEICIRMLAELIEKYNEIDMVIMAYKGGEGFAESWREQGKRLDVCDEVVDRTMYWQEVVNEVFE